MRRLIFICCLVISFASSYGQEPANHVTGFSVGTITATSIQLNWTGSVGPGTLPTDYLIIAKKTAGTFQTVTDGGTIADDNDFTDPNQNGAVNVVHAVGANTYTWSGLDQGTAYDFRIYPYTDGTTNYKTDGVVPAASATTTYAEPTAATTSMTFTSISATGLTVNVSTQAGTGTNRIVVARLNSAVSFTPVDNTTYTANSNFSAASEVGPGGDGNKVVGSGTGTSFAVTGLTGDQTYHFAVYEYNGTAGVENYFSTANTGSRQTEPTTQASGLNFTSVTTTGMTLNWTNGNGDRRLVIAREGSAVATDPTDFTSYTASANWNNGSPAGTAVGAGFVVYDGTGTSVALTNMASGTRYYFAVYEYNGAGTTSATYMTPGATADRYTINATEPTTPSTVTFSNITGSQIQVNVAGGNGTARLLVAKSGSAVDFTPTDGVSYTADANFSTSADVGSGNKVVGSGTGPFTVTGLTGDQTYHFAVYEFNGTAGTGAENYYATAGTGSRNTEPTTQASALNFTAVASTTLTLNWTSGNGDRRLVIARQGSAVATDPTDFANYTASSDWNNGSPSGTAVGAGNVVYDGTGTSVTLTNLVAATEYFFAVYEYNGAGVTSAAYLTPAATANRFTVTATEPSSASTVMTFANITGTQMDVNYGAGAGGADGNGASRLVVAKQGSAVDFVPVDGTTYTANTNYSAGTDLGSGNKVVKIGAGPVTVTNLTGDQAYHFAVFEFNGSGGTENYYTTALTGTQQTEPTTQASSINFTAVSNTSITVNWTNGNGDRRLVIARQGSAVATDPTDFTSYTASSDWNGGAPTGSAIGSGFVVYDGTSNSFTLTNLSTSTTYHFAVYEYNGSSTSAAVYLTPALAGSQATTNAPTTQASAVTFTPGGTPTTQLTINWTNGNGSSRIVVVKDATGVFTPVNGTTYAANLSFTGGSNIGSAGNVRCVFNGTLGGPITVTNLTANTTYTVQVYEYNNSAGSENYLTTTATGNPASRSTAHGTSPNTAGTGMTFSAISGTSITVNWTGGNGTSTMLVMRAGSAVSFTPSDGVTYTANSDYSAATEVGTGGQGNKVVAFRDDPSTTAVTITGLTADVTYHFSAVEFNGTQGTGAENYGAALTGNRNTEPSTNASSVVFSSLQTASYTLTWTNGNGDRRLVVARAGSAVSADPTDFTSYTPSTTYGSGTALGGGFVVFNGTGNSVSVSGLSANTVYHFSIFEANGAGSSTAAYLTPGYTFSRSTLASESANAPTSLSFTSVTSSSFTVNYSLNSGTPATDGVIAIRRVGASPTGTPADGTTYNVGDAIGNGTVAYVGSAASFGETGLSPFTDYYYDISSFGGSGEAINYKTSPLEGNQLTLCEEPSSAATGLTFGTVTSSSIALSWTRGNGTNVIVFAREGGTTADDPAKGTSYNASATYGSGDPITIPAEDWFCVYNGTGTSVTVTGLSASTSVAFKIYEYNTAGACYDIDGEITGSQSTTAAGATSTLASGSGAASVSSITDNNPTFSDRSAIFTFNVVDAGGDGNETQFTSFIIRPAAGNQIADWTQLFADADLYSDENAAATTADNATATIGTNTITFSLLTTGNNELGEVDDGETKTYTLQVWFKTALGGTLPSTVDGKNLQFTVSGADFTMAAGNTFVPATNTSSTATPITVTATKINTTTSPSTTAIATVPLAQQPAYEAADANNNRDLDFNNAITVNTNNPDNLVPTGAPANFVNGVATFSGFSFGSTGTSTMSVTANSITSANSASITVTATTTVAQVGNSVTATNGISSSPLNSASTNHALLGFSLVTDGSTLNFTGLTVTTNNDPDGKIKTIRLFESSDNTFSFAGDANLGAIATTPTASSINFTGFTTSISTTTKYFFVVADIETNVSATTPSLQLSLTPNAANVVVSGNPSISGSTFNGLIYSFLDVSNPTILSITNLVDPIYDGALTQTVKVVFSETMKTGGAARPGINISGGSFGAQTDVGWSSTFVPNDTYTATFNHNGVTQTLTGITTFIISPSGAEDITGNPDTGGATSAPFDIDTDNPDPTINVSLGTIHLDALTQTVTILYNESMDAGSTPTITFGSANFSPANAGAWSTTTFTNDTWTRDYVHNGNSETIFITASVNAVSGALDVAGNQATAATTASFLVDTDTPDISFINSGAANGTYTTGTTITINVAFDETVYVTGTPTLSLNSGGTAFYVSGSGTSTLNFNYTVAASQNSTDLDVTALNLAGGTIQDNPTNDASLTLPLTPNRLQDLKNIIIDTTAPTVTSVSSVTADGFYNAGSIISIQVNFSEPVTVAGIPQLALNSGGTAFYSSGTGTSTLTFQYTVAAGQNAADLDYTNTAALTLPGGAVIYDVVAINATLTLPAPGGANSISDDKSIVIDTVNPTVTSITVDTNTPPLNGIGSTNGTTQTSLTYRVTFSEPVLVTDLDATDFFDTGLGFAGYPAYPIVNGTVNAPVAVSPSGGYATAFDVTVGTITGSGTLRLDLNQAGLIRDRALNDNTASFTSGETYQKVLAEPSAHVTAQTATSNAPGQITVSWTNSSGGTHLLLVATGPDNTETTPTPFVPADGTWLGASTEENFADGNGLAIVDLVNSPAQTSYTFSNMRSGKTYTIDIYPYSLSPNTSNDNVNYRTAATVPQASTTTQTANSGTIAAGNTAPPATISSLQTAAFADVNYSFILADDGLDLSADDAKMLINQITINAYTTFDLSEVIEEAELVDITNTQTVMASGTDITSSSIVFTLSTTNEQEGEFDDNETKEFELRIRLKSTIDPAIAAYIDRERIEFYLNGSSFVYDANSSKIEVSQYNESDPLGFGYNEIDVDATELNFTTVPPATVFVLENVTATLTAPDNVNVPVVRAQDANGNTDEDFNGATFDVTVANTDNIQMLAFGNTVITTLTPSFGVVYFPGDFRYNDDGNGSLTVSGTGVTNTTNGGTTTVSYSNTSTITSSATLIEPSTISSLAVSSGNPVAVFDFEVHEDNNIGGDFSPTRITSIAIQQGAGNDIGTWTDVIAGAYLTDNTTLQVFPTTGNIQTGTVGASSISFTSMNTAVNALGYVTDNTTKRYTLWVYLKSSVASPTTVDNLNLVFSVANTNLTFNTLSSAMAATSTSTTGAQNAIDVDATLLRFITQPNSDLLVDTDISNQQTPVPQAEAVDVYGNRDLDYIGGITLTNNGGLLMSNAPTAFTAGLVTFANNFQYDQIGDGTLTMFAPGVSSVASNTVTVRVGISGTITTGNTADPATISSLVDTGAEEMEVFDFTINDDPGLAATHDENDGVPIRINTLYIVQSVDNTITDWTQAIAYAKLTDGTNSVDGFVYTNYIAFYSIPNSLGTDLGYVADDGSKTYNLRIYLKSALGGSLPTTIDGLNFGFEVVAPNVITDPNGTSIISTENENSGNNNEVTVVATQIDYSQLDATDNFVTPYSTLLFPAEGSINTDFDPRLGIEAHDVNGNRDLDFNGTITSFTTVNSLLFENEPTAPFTNGFLKFPSNFHYLSGNEEDGRLEITAEDTGLGITITSQSPTIIIRSSFETMMFGSIGQLNIPYVNYTSAAISSDGGNAYPLQYLYVYDGYADLYYGDLGAMAGDSDGANTNITSITVGLSNPQNIKKIGVYAWNFTLDQWEEQQELAKADITVTSGYGQVTFNALDIDAPDNDASDLDPSKYAYIAILATFDETAVSDNSIVEASILAVGTGGGSKFRGDPGDLVNPPNYIGGVVKSQPPYAPAATDAGVISPPHAIEVLATKIDFIVQPPAIAGVNEPVPLDGVDIITAQARDQYSVLDVDHNFTANLSTPQAGTNLSSVTFASGVLTLPTLQYTSVGAGKLTITSMNEFGNPISSNENDTGSTPNNVSVQCTTVDVINTVAVAVPDDNGVVTSSNLKGSSVNKVIFGVGFTAPYTITAKPKLNRFTIGFSNSIAGVLTNLRVYKSTSGLFAGSTNIEAIGGTLSLNGSGTALTVNLGSPEDLSLPANDNLTYFLQVNVEAAANSSTDPIQPFVLDNGYSDPLTDQNVVVSDGSAYASVYGKTYTFAAILPPTLESTYPAVGQTNVDPTQPSIDLVFSVPVWTLDGKVMLYDQTAGDNVGTELTALNGQFTGDFVGGTGLAGSPDEPLRFGLPTLLPDHVYYITITSGSYTAGAPDNRGIMDQNGNLFPGFSYSGTVYFKTASTSSPLLLKAPSSPNDPAIKNVTLNGATLFGTFDKKGTAFFMVVNSGDPAPTAAQIMDGSSIYAGTRVTFGSFNFDQINPIQQYGIINEQLAPNSSYDVWVYGESYSEKRSYNVAHQPVDTIHTPITNPGPYGGDAANFVAGGAGPTLIFSTGSAPSGPVVVTNNELDPSCNCIRTVQFCADSYQVLNSPIIISEGDPSGFDGGAQNFNLLLPSGFEFDVSMNGTVPMYGSITLSSGSDFTAGSGALSFINNSILRVSFTNNGSSSYDEIIISGLRIIANGEVSGQITRLGGSAFTSDIPDGTSFATLTSIVNDGIDFTNSYSRQQFGNDNVTTIRDNYSEPVELIPLPPAGDYGPSSFAGQGVNVNILNLAAVSVGIPFNITITHTDNNGCVTENSVQYRVYDHTTAIAGLSTEYCIVNTNFPAAADPGVQLDTISYSNLEGHYMFHFKADTLTDESPQIIDGMAWHDVLAQMTRIVETQTLGANNPNSAVHPEYYSYEIDRAAVLNANSLSGGAVPNPYENFIGTTLQGHTFYQGGSLGFIEFTAQYQSEADIELDSLPIKQLVEYFVPPIPVIEVDQSNQSFLDILDSANPADPVTGIVQGTPIFCEAGGKITIQAYPQADAGISTGTFTLYNGLDPITTTAFVDNENGTATLDPALFNNDYQNIRIVYEYKQLVSPCSGSATFHIRITPNPVPNFVVGTECEDIDVQFTDTSSIPQSTVSGSEVFEVVEWLWDFADPNSGPDNTSLDQHPTHVYRDFGAYPNVSLSVRSNYKCASVAPRLQNISIGGTPQANFAVAGVSSDLSFDASGSSVTPNDNFNTFGWDFGDGSPVETVNANTITHSYTDPGIDTVLLTVTSQKGCIGQQRRRVIILPFFEFAVDDVYSESFESASGKPAGAGWQAVSLVAERNDSVSWHWDDAREYWTTALMRNANDVGRYYYNERSALYTPVFDFSELTRPIISFLDSVFLHTGDGVVLEYSTDNKNVADPSKSWRRVGTNATGVDWYNGEILASKPGNHPETGDYGWTEAGKPQSSPEWRLSKHSLSDIPVAERDRVVFRFALASINEVNRFGFFLDDIRIGNGTRTVLVEHFSNSSVNDSEVVAENQAFRDFKEADGANIGVEIVKIDYHVAFPNGTMPDPFNEENPADPGARALYYNVSTVPQTRLDGIFLTDPPEFSQWGSAEFDRKVLDLANATITATPTVADGVITISGYYEPLDDLPGSTILHVAIIEETVALSDNPSLQSRIGSSETEFKYILRKMLPTAAGTKQMDATKGTQYPFEFTYSNSQLFMPENDLAVVIFLQNEITKKVYQSFIIRNVTDPGVNTGVLDPEKVVGVYPNPADEEFTIQLRSPVKKRTALQLYDQMGKVVKETFLEKGESSKTVGTSQFAAGVYLIQVDTEEGLTRRKVLIVHDN